jgi:hypothetical protein
MLINAAGEALFIVSGSSYLVNLPLRTCSRSRFRHRIEHPEWEEDLIQAGGARVLLSIAQPWCRDILVRIDIKSTGKITRK